MCVWQMNGGKTKDRLLIFSHVCVYLNVCAWVLSCGYLYLYNTYYELQRPATTFNNTNKFSRKFLHLFDTMFYSRTLNGNASIATNSQHEKHYRSVKHDKTSVIIIMCANITCLYLCVYALFIHSTHSHRVSSLHVRASNVASTFCLLSVYQLKYLFHSQFSFTWIISLCFFLLSQHLKWILCIVVVISGLWEYACSALKSFVVYNLRVVHRNVNYYP